MLLPRFKGDQEGEGQRISISRGKAREPCPVRAIEDWLRAAEIRCQRRLKSDPHRLGPPVET
ncbi:site-specific integrase [Paracraurococcus ruber]|uniref:hypothetical protein n=1 Tax=Paracraurococcus ruber TaxID=77675 RepID=UPI0010582431|nr:hypothetical protein [Paracraurococcus ruber]TDG27031.1 hypothetical protein E2C05_24315 [Paracraurococcus ruber]